MKLTQNQYYGLRIDLPHSLSAGSVYLCQDTKQLFFYGEDWLPSELKPADGVITQEILDEALNNISIGTFINVVSSYSELPIVSSVPSSFYFCTNSQGTKWLPGDIGGTYYPKGIYYSNGISWSYVESPYQSTQEEANEGIANNKFITPNTLVNHSKWALKTDLTYSEDSYVKYAGSIKNVDLGEYKLKAGQIDFDTTPTQSSGVASLRWNDTDGTLDLGLKGGNVTLQLGQESLIRVVNKTATNLTEAGYEAVYISGAQGQRLKVDLALANSDLTSAGTIGIVTENIDVNQEGFVTSNGLVRGINTTGSLQGETWLDGNMLYLSPTVAGRITNIKPIAPYHTVVIGVCVHAHSTQGSIFVKVDNGYELEELHNVLISTPLNNEILSYETSSGLWKNKSITSLGGVSGTGTLDYLPKFSSAGTLIDSNILNSDNFTLINGVPNITGVNPVVLQVRGTQTSSAWTAGAKFVTLQFNSTDVSSTGDVTRGEIAMVMTDATGGFSDMIFGTTSSVATPAVERMRLSAGGKLLLGTIAGTGNHMLQIIGGSRVRGTTVTSDWIAGFEQSGVTLQAGLVGTSSNRSVTVQGAGAAIYHGMDTTNNVEFLMGVSGFQSAVVGSMTNHPLHFRTNNTLISQFTIDGNLLIGTSTNNGKKLQVIGGGYFSENFSGIDTKLTVRNAAVFPGAGNAISFEGFYKHALISSIGFPSSTTGGDLRLQTYTSDAILTEGITIDRTGRVLVNTSADDGASQLQVEGQTKFTGLSIVKGTTASDTAPLGTELTTTGVSDASWTGTSFATGYTHLSGSITTLTQALSAVIGAFHQITYTISGRTAGSISISFGGNSTTGITATGNTGPIATTIEELVITPTIDFDGTLILSIKLINTSSAISQTSSSSGSIHLETRISSSNTNTFIGQGVGRRSTTGVNNTGIGMLALRDVTTGTGNTSLGYAALIQNTIGTSNVALGNQTLFANKTGINNIAIGPQTLYNNNSSGNIAIGLQAMYNSTSGGNNTSIGYASLFPNVTGNNNVSFGYNSGRFISNGTTSLTNVSNSIFVGYSTKALQDNSTGEIVIGYNQTGLGSSSTIIGNNSTIKTAILGRIMFGSTVDDGINQLQVTGTTKSTNLNISSLTGAYGQIASFDTLGNVITNPNLKIINGVLDMSSLTAAEIKASGVSLTLSGLYSIFFKANGSEGMRLTPNQNLLIKSTSDDGINALQVTGSVKSTSSVQVGDSAVTASSANVGAIRYRSDSNNSYMDMVMQTGASTYEWVNVVKNTWT